MDGRDVSSTPLLGRLLAAEARPREPGQVGGLGGGRGFGRGWSLGPSAVDGSMKCETQARTLQSSLKIWRAFLCPFRIRFETAAHAFDLYRSFALRFGSLNTNLFCANAGQHIVQPRANCTQYVLGIAAESHSTPRPGPWHSGCDLCDGPSRVYPAVPPPRHESKTYEVAWHKRLNGDDVRAESSDDSSSALSGCWRRMYKYLVPVQAYGLHS